MTRRVIPVSDLVPDGGTLVLEGTTVDVNNGMQARQPIGAALVLHVHNLGASPGVITIRSGEISVARRAYLGDLIVQVPPGEGRFVGPLDPGRFSQADRSIWVDCSPDLAGAIAGYAIPSVRAHRTL